MGKPSIFSRDYEKIMRRRRINMILFILLIISIIYFFGDKFFNINFLKGIKFGNQNEKKSSSLVKKDLKNDYKTENSVNIIKYKKEDGSFIQIYVDKDKIVDIKDPSGNTNFDISDDKTFVVFDDIKSGKIIMFDTVNFTEISKDYYRSPKLGKIFYRKDILKSNPNYIWAAKPYILSDKKVIFISQLPYFKKNSQLYLWILDLKTKNSKRISSLSIKDVNSVEYIPYSEGLKIKIENNIYVLKKGSYRLIK
ncbi:hypothetical protein SAMN05660865_01164 [Caloramator fervidus]|uniref:Uncharacterized protein n=1 Tax=Caloramator fervidus TaxID=29344 RepID=A0A1H5VBD7_9CLOT|nr:hypothetical protein [Caloramator fervidus]SEF84523.1 hypothetical protein SAMN05660865_01164 [Caloramator fervidus]